MPNPQTTPPVGPKRIWLHGIGGHAGEITWCDDPNPSGAPDEAKNAVEYVRADIAAPRPPAEAEIVEKRRYIADQLDQALVEREVERFKVIAFVHRHEITAALRTTLSETSTGDQGREG